MQTTGPPGRAQATRLSGAKTAKHRAQASKRPIRFMHLQCRFLPRPLSEGLLKTASLARELGDTQKHAHIILGERMIAGVALFGMRTPTRRLNA